MKDFNFFEPYIKEPEKQLKEGSVLKLVSVVFLSALIVLFAVNEMRIAGIKKETENYQNLTKDEAYVAQVAEIEVKQPNLEQLKKEKEFFDKLSAFVAQNDYVNESFVRFLSSEIPENVYFTDLSIVNRDIVIQGDSNTKSGVAQLEYNLRQTGDFENVFVPEMEKEQTFYRFSMILQTKDVNADEN